MKKSKQETHFLQTDESKGIIFNAMQRKTQRGDEKRKSAPPWESDGTAPLLNMN